MRRVLAGFNQTDLAAKFRLEKGGFCYTLAADWCRRILLETRKTKSNVPTQTPQARMDYFTQETVAIFIAEDHRRYIQHNTVARQHAAEAHALYLTAQLFLTSEPDDSPHGSRAARGSV